jgi:putative transposase
MLRAGSTGCSLRKTQEILRLLGIQRSHQTIFQWVHRVADSVPDPPKAQPKRVAVNETAVEINGEWFWLCAAIDLDTKLILGVDLLGTHGTDPPVRFSINSPKGTTSPRPCFSLIPSAIRLPLLD